MSAQSPVRLLFMLPLLFLMGKIDFENENILNGARLCFAAMQFLSLLFVWMCRTKIEAMHDMTKIYIPVPKKPFSDPNAPTEPPTETTYYEHEYAKVKEFLSQTIVGAVISSVIHFKFGVNQVVVLQSIMIPFNLFENPLIKKYIFGKHGRVWDEKLEGEDKGQIASSSSSTKKNETIQAEKKKVSSIDEEIVSSWDAAGDADFKRLFSIIKSKPNTKTAKDGWTALMIACGSPLDTTQFIEDLIQLKADVLIQDNDGWTALHWSAFHDRPEAAKTLLTNSNQIKLLDIVDNEGKTALDLAKQEENNEVITVIEEFTHSLTKEKKEEETELRQRKGFDVEKKASIGDID